MYTTKKPMNKQNALQEIAYLLGWWLATIRLHNCIDFYDINRIAEGFALKLLNQLYNYQLVNLNLCRRNHPAIDLGDKKNGIAFQVTSQTNISKIKKNLRAFMKEYEKDYPKGIRFLILSMDETKIEKLEKGSLRNICNTFNPAEHIISGKKLIQRIDRLYDESKDRFNRVRQMMEEEIRLKTNRF